VNFLLYAGAFWVRFGFKNSGALGGGECYVEYRDV
jgi:hypothetical protein